MRNTLGRIGDINQPLIPGKKEESEKQIREEVADHRRRKIAATDPNKKKESPWKVVGEGETPKPFFEWKLGDKNTCIEVKQLQIDPSIDNNPKFTGRRFKTLVKQTCGGPSGLTLEAGCIVDSYSGTAFALVGAGRGKILEEYPG